MEQQFKVSAVQFNIRLGDVGENLRKASTGLEKAAALGARLAVLPEMWSTGYDYKRLAELAERTPQVVEEVVALAAKYDLVVVGSLPERHAGKIFNTAYVIDRGRLAGRYRKLHLFSVMQEDRYLGAGDQSLVAATSVGRIGVAICYDLRFPELFRKLALEGAEIVCLPAEWPKPRQEHWRTLLRARAIENQLYVAACNCCGRQGKLDFFGMSLLIAPRGEILAESGEDDSVLVANVSRAELTDYRTQIPCFRDRRPDIYGTLP